MKPITAAFTTEARLFLRNVMGFFFTFIFPPLMLLLFGSLYGNEPTHFYDGRGAMDVEVPSYAGMVIAVTGLMCLPLGLAEYKERGVYKRFDATPAGKGLIILCQILVNIVMTACGIALLLAMGLALYNINIPGSPLAIVGSLALSIAAIFSLGFFITAIAPTAKIANMLAFLLYFVMLFSSGATIPVEMFPEGFMRFAQFLPLTHVVQLLKNSFFRSPARDSLTQLVVLSLCALCFGGLGALLYRRKSWS